MTDDPYDMSWPAATHHPTHAALAQVLEDAFEQSATGKGQERHGSGLPLEQQPIMLLPHLLNSVDGLSYQVMKKIQEATKMFKAGKIEAAEREFLGAIVYSACSVLWMRGQKELRDKAMAREAARAWAASVGPKATRDESELPLPASEQMVAAVEEALAQPK